MTNKLFVENLFLTTIIVFGILFRTPAHAGGESAQDEVKRASAYVDATCQCMFDHYRPANPKDTGMKICLEQARSTHNIPADVTEKFSVQVGPTTVTHPKLFSSEEANNAFATKQQDCTLKFSTALQDFQNREWSEDEICMRQCSDQGKLKKLCNTVCMDKRLPPIEEDTPSTESAKPESCEEQCEHLSGRSQYACERKCKTATAQ